jgi:hypothetical protein
MPTHRLITRVLVLAALTGLLLELGKSVASKPGLTFALWVISTLPAIASLLISIARELWVGRLDVDAVVSQCRRRLAWRGLARR